MDDFKHINDTFGHEGGDIALKSVAEHLRSCVRDSDTVARLGGDEFSILVNNVKSQEDVRIVAQKILAAFAQPIQVQQSHLALSASIGVSIYPEHGREAETLLRKADLAMYVVKGRAKNDFLFFDEQHKA
jgi:diguanylate cyclase (GGDEF)-like protein